MGIGELGVAGATGALDLVGAECCFKSRFGTGGVPGVVGALLTAPLVAEVPFEAGLYPAKKAFHSSGIEFGSRRYCSYISSTSHSFAPKEPPNLFSGVIPVTESKPIFDSAPRPTELEVGESGIDHKKGPRDISAYRSKKWGERRGLNPRHPGPQPGALPAELRPP